MIRAKYCNNLNHIHGGNIEMYIQNNLWRNRVHQVIPHIHTFVPPRGFLLHFKLAAAVTKILFSLACILVLILGCKDRGQTEQWEANSVNSKGILWITDRTEMSLVCNVTWISNQTIEYQRSHLQIGLIKQRILYTNIYTFSGKMLGSLFSAKYVTFSNCFSLTKNTEKWKLRNDDPFRL